MMEASILSTQSAVTDDESQDNTCKVEMQAETFKERIMETLTGFSEESSSSQSQSCSSFSEKATSRDNVQNASNERHYGTTFSPGFSLPTSKKLSQDFLQKRRKLHDNKLFKKFNQSLQNHGLEGNGLFHTKTTEHEQQVQYWSDKSNKPGSSPQTFEKTDESDADVSNVPSGSTCNPEIFEDSEEQEEEEEEDEELGNKSESSKDSADDAKFKSIVSSETSKSPKTSSNIVTSSDSFMATYSKYLPPELIDNKVFKFPAEFLSQTAPETEGGIQDPVVFSTQVNNPLALKETKNEHFDKTLKYVLEQGTKTVKRSYSTKSASQDSPLSQPSMLDSSDNATSSGLPSEDGEKAPAGKVEVLDIPVVVDGKLYHSCNVCSKQFKTPKEIRIHFRTHTNEKPFACEICGKKFRQRAHLKSHDKIHNGEKPYSCELCGTSFTENSSLKRHLRNHFGIKPYKCSQCEEAFITSTALKAHIKRRHEVKIIETFTCPICPKYYSCRESLRKHIKSHDPATRISCPICDQVCLTHGHLKKHQRIHKELKQEETPRREKPFECGICQKRYTTKPHLEDHLLTHGDSTPFNCDRCESAFKTKSLLRRHVLMSHTSKVKLEKPYKCSMCDRSFRLPRFLHLHISHSHKGKEEKKLQCKECGKAFSQEETFFAHMASHKVKRKFECKLCGEEQPSLEDLKEHKRQSHGEPTNKSFSCNECGKVFRRRYTLKLHISFKHKGEGPDFTCPHCDARMCSGSSLKRHLIRSCKVLNGSSASLDKTDDLQEKGSFMDSEETHQRNENSNTFSSDDTIIDSDTAGAQYDVGNCSDVDSEAEMYLENSGMQADMSDDDNNALNDKSYDDNNGNEEAMETEKDKVNFDDMAKDDSMDDYDDDDEAIEFGDDEYNEDEDDEDLAEWSNA